MTAPSAAHLDDTLLEHLLVFDGEGAAHAEVVERPRPAIGDYVEAGEVPACVASVTNRRHRNRNATGTTRKLGSVLHAFVLIDAQPARIATVAEALAETDGITEVFSVAGGVCDLIAIVRVRRHEELVEVVTKRIASQDGIESTTTLVAFQAFSRHDLEALWDVGPA